MFYQITPQTVTDAILTSNVLDVGPAEYNGGTTYADGDTVSVTVGTVVSIYESLQAGNTGNAPASSPLWWQLISTTYETWDSATTYADGEYVVYGSRVYLSLQGSNLNKNPLTETTFWYDYGPTNQWAMFDNQIDTQTIRYENVSVDIEATARFDTLALFNLDASSVTITITDSDEVEQYNEVVSLVDYSAIEDYWDHFFNPVERVNTITRTDLPIFTGLTLSVSVDAEADDVAVGTLVYGQKKEFGATLFGSQIGFINYSDIDADEFGRRAIVPRTYKKQGDFDIVARSGIDSIYKRILSLVATPSLFIAEDSLELFVYFGLITSAKINIPYRDYYTIRVQLEDF